MVMFEVKVFYGVRWALKGQSRKLFLPYYRIGLSVDSMAILMNVMACSVNHKTLNLLFLFAAGMFFTTLQILLLHCYMMHLDKLHLAKNNLARDKHIIKLYKQ